MTDIRLPDNAESVLALRTQTDRVLVGLVLSNERSLVASVDGTRLDPMFEHSGRIAALGVTSESLAVVFSAASSAVLVWGQPDELRERTWDGPVSTIDVAISGNDLAFGVTRLAADQTPRGSEIRMSRDGGQRWATLDLGEAELGSLTFVSSRLWITKSGPVGTEAVYLVSPNDSLRRIAAGGTDEGIIRLLPARGGVWAVGSRTKFLRVPS